MCKNRINMYKNILVKLLYTTSALVLIFGAASSWLLKDGLGPDSIESRGIEALVKSISSFWPIIILSSSLLLIAKLIKLKNK